MEREIENGASNYTMNEELIGGNSYRPNGTLETYTCDDGYSLVGDANRICDTGNWMGTVPVCVESKRWVCITLCVYSSRNMYEHKLKVGQFCSESIMLCG